MNKKNVKLYQGNCLELLGQVGEASVDLILADLPYGTTDRKGKGGSRILNGTLFSRLNNCGLTIKEFLSQLERWF